VLVFSSRQVVVGPACGRQDSSKYLSSLLFGAWLSRHLSRGYSSTPNPLKVLRAFCSSGSHSAVFIWGVSAACALLACGRSGFAICHRFCKCLLLVSSFLKTSLFFQRYETKTSPVAHRVVARLAFAHLLRICSAPTALTPLAAPSFVPLSGALSASLFD